MNIDNIEMIAHYVDDNDEGFIKRVNDGYQIIYSNKKENITDNKLDFVSLCDVMNYLRNVRLDHAINYNMKHLSTNLLGEIYKNKDVKIENILG
jgi:hypothetical protein